MELGMQSSQLEFEGVKWRVATADRLHIWSCVFFFLATTRRLFRHHRLLSAMLRVTREQNII
jgi:hypothetical protein